MRVLIIGATGRTGQLVLSEALSRGHSVTALARRPSALKNANPNLTVVEGTPEKQEDIVAAIETSFNEPPSAIIVTLSSPRESDSPFAKAVGDPWFMTKSAQNIRAAMKETGLKQTKIVIMSAWGVTDSWSSLNLLMKGVISHTPMKVGFKDHDRVEEETKAQEFPYVIVKPVMLTDLDAAPIKELGDAGQKAGFMPKISRASVASFLIDAAEKSEWDMRTPVISN